MKRNRIVETIDLAGATGAGVAVGIENPADTGEGDHTPAAVTTDAVAATLNRGVRMVVEIGLGHAIRETAVRSVGGRRGGSAGGGSLRRARASTCRPQREEFIYLRRKNLLD